MTTKYRNSCVTRVKYNAVNGLTWAVKPEVKGHRTTGCLIGKVDDFDLSTSVGDIIILEADGVDTKWVIVNVAHSMAAAFMFYGGYYVVGVSFAGSHERL